MTIVRRVDPPRSAFIDGLRGMAILGVLAVHLSQTVAAYGGAGAFRGLFFLQFVEAGARGVQLFFMLSAFTLFSSAKVRFASEPAPAFSFYVRRAFRILPLWWIATAAYAYLGGSGLASWWPSALMYFGFIRYRDGAEVFGLGWSIFVEETFYAMFPFVFSRVSDLRRSFLFVAAACVVSILWEHSAPKLGVPAAHDFRFLFPLNQWFCIAMGITAYFLSEEPLFQRIIIENARWAPIFDALTAIALFVLIRESHMAASFALLALFLTAMSPYTLFGKIARSRMLGLLGICCYSIYLFHLMLLTRLSPHMQGLFEGLGMAHARTDFRFLAALPVFAAVCLLGGLACWFGLERPCISMGRAVNAFLARHGQRLPAAADLAG